LFDDESVVPMKTIQYTLDNEFATQELGKKLAFACQELLESTGSLFITLEGELGTGKTTLVRSCLYALGVEGAIKSPTYTLLEPYSIELNNRDKRLNIAHLDLYRLQEPEELDYLGARNLSNDYHLVFVEWPEMGQGSLPQPDLKIKLNHVHRGRKALISWLTQNGQSIVKIL